jgi:hypothetical protein
MALRRRARGAEANPVRSVRIEGPIWARAVARAEAEGLTISEVIKRFVEGYGDRHLNAPRSVMAYAATRATPAVAPPEFAAPVN